MRKIPNDYFEREHQIYISTCSSRTIWRKDQKLLVRKLAKLSSEKGKIMLCIFTVMNASVTYMYLYIHVYTGIWII
jgi:hypothetical protein